MAVAKPVFIAPPSLRLRSWWTTRTCAVGGGQLVGELAACGRSRRRRRRSARSRRSRPPRPARSHASLAGVDARARCTSSSFHIGKKIESFSNGSRRRPRIAAARVRRRPRRGAVRRRPRPRYGPSRHVATIRTADATAGRRPHADRAARRRPRRPGELTRGWRLRHRRRRGSWCSSPSSAVWKTSRELGLRTWWLGPVGEPQPVFVHAAAVRRRRSRWSSLALNNARRLPWFGLGAAASVASIGVARPRPRPSASASSSWPSPAPPRWCLGRHRRRLPAVASVVAPATASR